MRPHTREQILAIADAILKANPEPQSSVRIRFRGLRPAWNWLRKRDEKGAAALWLIARERLPQAANDNLPTEAGLNVDRSRKDGKPRGKNADPRSLEAYLELPSAKPRLGDPEPVQAQTGNWDGASRCVSIKRQRKSGDYEFYPLGRFTKCKTAIAPGAIFLGAIGGLGQPKAGKRRGDIRSQPAADSATPPDEIDTVIETVLAGGNVADVGRALGANGGYADRRGGKALLDAGRWAVSALANDNARRLASAAAFVTNAAANSG